MGIRIDFLVKHVRPHGTDSMETILCGGDLKNCLSSMGVSENNIATALLKWAVTADLAIDNNNMGEFVNTANLVSLVRWEVLYQTDKSTILFLNGPLIKELSYQSEKNKGKTFEFNPHENIPLAVTINKNGVAQVDLNVKGAMVKSDADGNCFHFEGLVN